MDYVGNAGIATYAINAGIATYATNAGIATYATNAGVSTYATIAGYSTSSGIATYATNAGIATYATSSGIATNLNGGLAGNIPYQSAPNTTAFLTNGGSGTILQSNGDGNAPSWVAAAPAGAVTGLTIRDFNSTVVGTAGSVSQLTFGTGLSVTGTTGAAGIATIRIADNIVGTSLSISGITTSSEFVGGGSDLRNLSGTHLVSYASASDISNSALSIAGINTYTQVGILTGSFATNTNDYFGWSVATSADGKTIIVGAYQDEIGATTNTGVVYVFDRVGNSFNQVGIITSSLANNADAFGSSVATSADGKTIIVGAPSDEIGANSSSGITYVFDRIGNSFNQVGILTGSLAVDNFDGFGWSVAISDNGKTIVIGAYNDEIDENNLDVGVVYVYDRIGNSFNQVGILTGSATQSGDYFGTSVSISGDGKTVGVSDVFRTYIFDRVGNTFNEALLLNNIGQYNDKVLLDNLGKTIFISDISNRTVYVLDRVGNSFNQVGILTGSLAVDSLDSFGESVATSADGKTIVVSASRDEIGATTDTGVVYIFNRQGNNFNQVGILTGTYATNSNDLFGNAVSVSADGKTVIVGARADEIGATTSTGIAYVYDQVRETYVYSGPTGNIGIGTTNPTSKLTVQGDVLVSGVVTATTYYGSGANLTGISASGGVSISTNTTNQAQYLTYVTGTGSTTGFGITTTGLTFNPSTGLITSNQLDLTASASANDSVLYLSGAPTGSSGTNGLFGIGALSFSDTDIIADFTHSVNSYAQLVVQNKNSGSSSSADIVVNNDRSAGTTYYGDFGINGTTFAAGGPFGDVDGTYLYSAGGTLSLGSLNSYDVKIATNNTERVRILNTGNVGIGTTNPGATLNVVPTASSIAGLFSGTTSSDMVRITQLGSGNALVVEDSANPDSSPFVVTGIGSVGIGTASPAFTADIAGDARITSTNKMRFGGTAGTTNFYIQYNSTANSLDFVAG